MGILTLFSLPLGNTGDLTERTREILSVDGIFLAEDTRTLKDFLRLIGEKIEGKQFISFHEHNDTSRNNFVLRLLNDNERIYMTSDAGSPVVSDPAYPMIRSALENGHQIQTLPGVSSVICALELSGLPPYPFKFHGFFPREKGKKTSLFNNLSSGTNIFFESPHRILDTLEILSKIDLSCQVAVCREISKKFETVYRFNSLDFSEIKNDIIAKGEFVVCIFNNNKENSHNLVSEELKELVNKYLSKRGKKKDLAKILSSITGEKVKIIYDKLIHEE